MRDDHELNGIEDVLPDDVSGSSEGGHGVEEGVRHPNAEGGVFLAEGLSGGDGGDLVHGSRCGGGVDEHILVIAALAGGRKPVTDQFAESELNQADEEGGY